MRGTAAHSIHWRAGCAALVLVLAAVLPVRGARSCVGDCNADGVVTVDEVVRAVSIGISTLGVEACPAADSDGDGTVTISEVTGAVAAGLAGCDSAPPTPTASPTSSVDPDPSPARTSIPCEDISGRWTSEERGSVTCNVAGSAEPQIIEIKGEEEIKISQSGCQVSYQVPSVDLGRTGTVEGSRVSFFGAFFESERGVTFGENLAALVGAISNDRIDLESTGRSLGTASGSIDFTCTGTSVVVFTRRD